MTGYDGPGLDNTADNITYFRESLRRAMNIVKCVEPGDEAPVAVDNMSDKDMMRLYHKQRKDTREAILQTMWKNDYPNSEI